MQRVNRHFLILKSALLIFVCVGVLAPISYMITRSFEGGGLSNYSAIFTDKQINIAVNFLNSFFVSAVSIVLVVVMTSLAAFAFSKLNFKGKNVIYITLMLGMMIPSSTILLPLFTVTKAMGLMNHTASLIGPYTSFTAIFCLVIMKNFYDTIPNQLLEAARIDGCSQFHTFIRIIFPLSYPALIVIVIWTFLQCWNELLLALIFLTDKDQMTITQVPIQMFYSFVRVQQLGKMFAAFTTTVSPVVILYIFLQKYFVIGLTGGAVKE